MSPQCSSTIPVCSHDPRTSPCTLDAQRERMLHMFLPHSTVHAQTSSDSILTTTVHCVIPEQMLMQQFSWMRCKSNKRAGTIMGVHAMMELNLCPDASDSICWIARHVLITCGWCTPEQTFMQATGDRMDMSTNTDM